MKRVLDVCCGGRMFWFDKKHPDTLYLDNRTLPPTKLSNGATMAVQPDKVMDFRKLSLPARSFNLVVFDPPHLTRNGRRSWMHKKYGSLDRSTWRDDLSAGFAECFRVLKRGGVLVFKWNETDIPLKDVLALAPIPPLFGHPSGKAAKTHWVCFIK